MAITGVHPTSYFSAPSSELDPTLFQGRQLRSWVRQGINSILNDFLSQRFRHPELWSHPWLAGSGVSYQWEAARQPGDLDCLIGINYVQFRKANPEYTGLSDREISEHLNDEFREHLYPKTANWNGYELTFYVNPGASDIRSIKPYAAYDLKYDEWTVYPNPQPRPPHAPEWEAVVNADADKVRTIHDRFNANLTAMQVVTSGPARRNIEATLTALGQQANALFDEIHNNRSIAFSPEGKGYGDFHNFRWQAGKAVGTIQSLRTIREHTKSLGKANAQELYGVDLPDSSTLIRRAAMQRNLPR